MTQHVLDHHRLNDPRVSDADIAAAVREIGFNKPVQRDDYLVQSYTVGDVMDMIVEKALIHSAKRETS